MAATIKSAANIISVDHRKRKNISLINTLVTPQPHINFYVIHAFCQSVFGDDKSLRMQARLSDFFRKLNIIVIKHVRQERAKFRDKRKPENNFPL